MTRRVLPDFLVIGAMKSGTTTLYNDLAAQASIYMTEVKEPAVLVRFPDPEKATDNYRRLFRTDHPGQLLGEASTLYTQLPRYVGVPERARALMGPDLRAIYLVRNPVERAISHHYHLIARGHTTEPFDVVARNDVTIVDFSRYAMQLEPWIAAFGRSQLHVVRFEDYVANRTQTLAGISGFLGAPFDVSRIQVDAAYNRAEDSGAPGRLRPLIRSDLYSLWLRRIVPLRVRATLRRWLIPHTERARHTPDLDTINFLIDRLHEDVERLGQLLGGTTPVWDLEATRVKYRSEVQKQSKIV